jgi:aminodeoxyfutalosine synthase
MLYGTIETIEERVDHMLQLRALQTETGGFQTSSHWRFILTTTRS